MINPFEIIYCWFVSLFGTRLADYLAGATCDGDAPIFEEGSKNLFTPIGIVALTIALVAFVAYYYIINSARLNKWWHWVIALLIVGVANLFIGYGWTAGEADNIGACLECWESDFWLFGLANFFVSAMFFIIFSIAFKWGSRNCRRTPF
jgi:uncharacterized membrane protein